MDTRAASTDLSAGRYAVTMDVGVDLTLPFEYLTAPTDDGPWTPVDLAGSSIEAEISKTSGEVTTKRALGTAIVDASAGLFTVDFFFENDPYPVGTYRYRITVIDSAGEPRPLIVSTVSFVSPPLA